MKDQNFSDYLERAGEFTTQAASWQVRDLHSGSDGLVAGARDESHG